MTEWIEKSLRWLGEQLPGRLSMPGDDHYTAATAIWAKPVGRMPRAVVHCRTPEDVQSAIRAARDCRLPLSVRGGGHDWALRALCHGIVIDLTGMRRILSWDPQHGIMQVEPGVTLQDVACTALADGWWELAAKEKDPAQLSLQRRAMHWYEAAVVQLAGLNRTKALSEPALRRAVIAAINPAYWLHDVFGAFAVPAR